MHAHPLVHKHKGISPKSFSQEKGTCPVSLHPSMPFKCSPTRMYFCDIFVKKKNKGKVCLLCQLFLYVTDRKEISTQFSWHVEISKSYGEKVLRRCFFERVKRNRCRSLGLGEPWCGKAHTCPKRPQLLSVQQGSMLS